MMNFANTLISFKNSHFIALMGQSNAVGYSEFYDSNFYNPRSGQYIFENVAMQWQALQQNKNNAGKYYSWLGYQGIELKLMQLLKDYYGSDQYMFKYAEGATQLAFLPGTGPNWDWNENSDNPYMYQGCVANFKAAVANLPAQIPAMKVLIWMQGEADAGNYTLANQYQTNFVNFITALKNAWNLPNLKVLQVLLSDTQTALDATLMGIVNTAKINLSTGDNKFVNTDGAETYGGGAFGIHYTISGYEDIAQRVFDVLITML